ncbi:TDP-N-acetylfucosamine:lipid II N-acetylfucosaminyltransferase [Halomonas sp. CnH100-B]|uniref:TDP-N-acetylfucosamine:lipid II N-acetylfucosaminyltransferase n=1 Tax=Halomonas sp. CnH100-B TaxID=2954490 RepID=UPI0020969129|nr:TDP-N-acetylfucosamine:lipid II N-acetylfucosaminyltransferase [Halomonas sp. CnH100-B]MCO7229520.1 TDP-N-acetylfucosamine:lipid II N-acetylfucosaminyltransferase [Halomonas sp. CnH100-B]
MSRKKSKRTNKPANSSALKPAMHHYLKEFQEHFDNRRYAQALAIANRLIDTFPKSPEVWELKANALGNLNRMREASDAMATSCSLLPHQNTKASIKYAQYLLLAGFAEEALKVLLPLHKYEPRNVKVWTWTSRAYHVLGRIEHALDANDKACDISPNDPEALLWRSRIMDQAKRPTEARKAAVKLKRIAPARLGVSNHIASLDLREGLYESAEQHFNDELRLQDNSSVATNLLVAKHYNPTYTVDDIYKAAREWQNKYVNSDLVNRASTKKYSNKRVRIGLLSGSFRIHPVGQMILPALQNLDNRELELFAYSTNQTTDNLTQRIKKCVNKWIDVAGLNEDELDNQIRQDRIDILIDLNGGGEGSRYQVISREPAPLIVKWVGMLINTTGLDCFDYLLSDGIETPFNVDKLYTEKLIRLPDDYVCYHIPDYIPDVNGLPALKNGYITFGCLNNPAKLSPPLIKEWADLLKEIPNSKLLLRGIQFEGEEFCKRMESRFFEHGIDRDRLILQGPARHQEFLTTYQSIDIALDTWPYSGGLTTCEALAMGVPVVTCVGPTFAGRHSATHLANAGLPELVTDNWEDFRKRAKELASDLPNLAVIRAALRTILKESPVCDGARFAKNFTKAMRGIWQRHCEGKTPEALTFNKEGDAWFADDAKPVELVEVRQESHEVLFDWKLDEPITVVDNGALFTRDKNFSKWMKTGNFAVISFDPGSLLTQQSVELKQLGEWHHYPHATLGDGQDATLYATLEPELTGTLKPLEARQTQDQEDPLRVLSTLPISTVPLNAVDGLPGVDLMVLDHLNDTLAILNNSEKYLKNTLAIKVKASVNPSHEGQSSVAQILDWAASNGFVCYNMTEFVYSPHPAMRHSVSQIEEQLESVSLVLVSEDLYQLNLRPDRLVKAAYLMSNVFSADGLAKALAEKYVKIEGVNASVLSDKSLVSEVTTGAHPNCFVHICFNNMHTQSLIEACEAVGSESHGSNVFFVNKARSVEGYSVAYDTKNVTFFDAAKDLESIIRYCKGKNVQGVYIHGLFFDWQKAILNEVGSIKKVAWVIWGGDIYRYQEPTNEMLKLVEKIACIATVTSDDYKVYERLFGQKKHFDFAYRFPFDELDKSLPVQKQKIIVVGNSGDVGNNHAEILDALSAKKDINDYRIIVPCSYNAPDGYASKLQQYALSKGFSKNRLEILTDFMSKEDYFDLIASAELLVTAHDRSQAGATINAAVYFGTKVVLKKTILYRESHMQNPMWSRLSDMSIQCVEFTDFLKSSTVNELPSKEDSMVEKDRANLRKARGDEALGQNLSRINSFLEV